MNWETKKLVWLTLFWWSGAESPIPLRYACTCEFSSFISSSDLAHSIVFGEKLCIIPILKNLLWLSLYVVYPGECSMCIWKESVVCCCVECCIYEAEIVTVLFHVLYFLIDLLCVLFTIESEILRSPSITVKLSTSPSILPVSFLESFLYYICVYNCYIFLMKGPFTNISVLLYHF